MIYDLFTYILLSKIRLKLNSENYFSLKLLILSICNFDNLNVAHLHNEKSFKFNNEEFLDNQIITVVVVAIYGRLSTISDMVLFRIPKEL